MEELLNKIREAAQGVEFSDRTTYIVVGLMSFVQIKAWDEDNSPLFLKGERPTQRIYLIPEISHRLGQREMVQDSADQLAKKLGEGFEGDVCATKNDLILSDDNFIKL